MESITMIPYLLLGVAGLGALLGLIVLAMALFPPRLEEYDQSDDLGEFEGETRMHVPYSGQYTGGAQPYPLQPELEESGVRPHGEALGIPLTPAQGFAPGETESVPETSNEEGMKDVASANAAVTEDTPAEDALDLPQDADDTRTIPAKPQDTMPLTPEDTLPDTPGSPAGQIPDTASIQVTDGSMRVGAHSLRLSSAQDIGARGEQQDAFEIGPRDPKHLAKRGLLCVLCDGMGGMRMGGEAARIATRSFVSAASASEEKPAEALLHAAEQANDRVWALCRADDTSGAGTTLVAVFIDQDGLSFLSVGDSHVYLMRGETLSQLNVDHNYLAELIQKVRRGEITRQQAIADPERAHLTSYLGMKRIAMIDQNIEPIALRTGDRIVLASDGLFKVLTPEEIERVISTFQADCASRLIDEALRRRYRNQDNISVVVVAVE